MIEQAVVHGARSFNAGHHTACTDIYMKTMRELIANGDYMPTTSSRLENLDPIGLALLDALQNDGR